MNFWNHSLRTGRWMAWLIGAALLLGAGALCAAEPIDVGPNDWPWWRGPSRDGRASPQASPPLTWSDEQGVLWKVPVPGRGHGSPTVVGDHIYLGTADVEAGTQSLLAYDRRDGRLLWQTVVHSGGVEVKGNSKTSLASSTPACDGQRVFINFLNGGAVHTSAVSRDGKLLWQTKVTDYILHQGFGSSPTVWDDLVIVSADNKGTGALAALERRTGRVVWQHARPQMPNYTSPIILRVAGRDQLLFTGCDLVSSFDPVAGTKLWEIAGATTECVTSTVSDGKVIVTSGGYPKNHLSAVRGDGSGQVVWQNNTRVYVPSMIVRGEYLYGVLDAGVATCWRLDTGEEVWKGRLGGTFSASLVLAGERIYATNEAGRTFVFRAVPDDFELLAENPLGTETFATLSLCGKHAYHRFAQQEQGRRQEYLAALGPAGNAP